jgi:hypothetical protein
MPDLDFIRWEIEHVLVQVGRQRKEILQLQQAGISTASAEALLERMLAKIVKLCAERDRLSLPALDGAVRQWLLTGAPLLPWRFACEAFAQEPIHCKLRFTL